MHAHTHTTKHAEYCKNRSGRHQLRWEPAAAWQQHVISPLASCTVFHHDLQPPELGATTWRLKAKLEATGRRAGVWTEGWAILVKEVKVLVAVVARVAYLCATARKSVLEHPQR